MFAQITIRIGTHENIGKWNPTSMVTPFANVSEGKSIAKEIIDIVGLKANFEVREANVPNAAAVVYGGRRYVLYNPSFINQLERTTGTKWAGISVLAHEIGHHLNGHTITSSGSQPALELESDEFSGFVLRKMGASLAEAQAAMKTLATVKSSRTHPGQYDRLTAIANGWNKADIQMGGRTAIAKQKPKVNSSQPAIRKTNEYPSTSGQTAIADKYIAAVVRFNSDPRSGYYITTQHNVVRVRNNQLAVIGKLVRLNSTSYPYMIYDSSNNRLYIDRYGNIVNRQGRKVGAMKTA